MGPGDAALYVGLSFGLAGIVGSVLGAVAARYLADITLLCFLPGLPTRWRVFLVVAAFLLIAVSVVVANLVAELIYGWLDPRVSEG